MLFLAVTLGFFVENQREHYIEHLRTKEYARQMNDDLKNDTAEYNWIIQQIDSYVKNFDTVNVLFDHSPPVSNRRLLTAVLTRRATFGMPAATMTFNQMKNSGTIRYFRNKDLSKQISHYYEATIPPLIQSLEYDDDFFNRELQSFMLNHFDYNQSDFLTDTLKVSDPVYLERNAKNDLLLRNRLIHYNSLLQYTVNFWLKRGRNEATELMDFLSKEYHLE